MIPLSTPPAMLHPEAEATMNQINFLVSLAVRHDVGYSVEGARGQVLALAATGKFTRKMASDMIDAWKAKPKREAATNAGKQAAPGYYAHDGKFVVVVENKAKTRTYAKVLKRDEDTGGKWRWLYERGLGANVANLTPMTIEQAAAFGHLHGICVICTTPLTDPESVRRGIGPTCAKRLQR